MSPYFAEVIGTALLILFGNGVVANMVLARSKGNGGGWICIAAGWGFAVAIAVFAVGRVSGAHLNPAVTIALASIESFPWALVPGFIVAQFVGAALGAGAVYLAYLAHWEHTADPGTKLACYSTAPAIRRFGPAFVTEFIGTGVLVFGVLAFGRVIAGAPTEQSAWAATMHLWFGPGLVGLLVFALGLSLGGPTGYAINPARDLGPRIMHALLPISGKGSSDWEYAWIPVVAPILGGVAGAQFFRAINL